MLKKRVGSPLSYRSLAEDLQVSPNTVRNYIDILASLYIIFLVRPYHRNISRSIQKEPKLYFYDPGVVSGDYGIKLENAVAVSLLKHAHFLQDTKGKNVELLPYVKAVQIVMNLNGPVDHRGKISISKKQGNI
jgi:hypothetical protein